MFEDNLGIPAFPLLSLHVLPLNHSPRMNVLQVQRLPSKSAKQLCGTIFAPQIIVSCFPHSFAHSEDTYFINEFPMQDIVASAFMGVSNGNGEWRIGVR